MAWTDKPTYSQLETIFRWFEWLMPRDEATGAVKWLEQHATRKDASEEIERMYPLFRARSLTREECFNSRLWDTYEVCLGKYEVRLDRDNTELKDGQNGRAI